MHARSLVLLIFEALQKCYVFLLFFLNTHVSNVAFNGKSFIFIIV